MGEVSGDIQTLRAPVGSSSLSCTCPENGVKVPGCSGPPHSSWELLCLEHSLCPAGDLAFRTLLVLPPSLGSGARPHLCPVSDRQLSSQHPAMSPGAGPGSVSVCPLQPAQFLGHGRCPAKGKERVSGARVGSQRGAA